MNNKGFTLVELLAVLIILALISIIIIPAITSVMDQSNNTIYTAQTNKILNSAYDYSLKNTNLLPEYKNIKYVTLGEIKKEGHIESDIKNPTNGEMFPDNLVISIKNVGTKYKSKSDMEMKKGYYLYKIENEFMNTQNFINNMPTITFENYDYIPSLIKIDVGTRYIPLKYKATSKDGLDITDKVIENIMYDSTIVNTINAVKAGIYDVNYSVVDLNGYSNLVTIKFVVIDDSAPKLTIPDNITLTIDDTSYDIMEGVSCYDNSGFCEIKVNGSVKFGVVGKNIIEYVSADPTGNTTSLKRVITIK